MEEIGRNESIRVTIDGGAVVAEGDIDLAGGPLLDTAILRLEASGPVVIDLTAVEFIDSSGLRSLLTASRRAEGRNSVVVLRNPSAGVKRLLSITGTLTSSRSRTATARWPLAARSDRRRHSVGFELGGRRLRCRHTDTPASAFDGEGRTTDGELDRLAHRHDSR